jgi:hypothetical protein
MNIGISLINRKDSTTGKVRLLSANLRGRYTTLCRKLYTKEVFPEEGN